MRITMICIGSMGDVRPYIVLGRELKARGHEISICAFTDFRATTEGEGMRFCPVFGDVRSFMSRIMKPGTNGVNYLRQLRNGLLEILDPFLHDIEAGCDGAEAIIGTYFGMVFQSIAEVRHLPFIQTHYFPMDPNPSTPIASAPGQHAGRAWRMASYPLAYLLISTMERYYLADWRKAHGMNPRKLERKPSYELNGHVVPVLYAMSPLLMTRPATWGANIHMTGFWLDSQPFTYSPEPELQSFLNDGEPPIYIGFGSMTSGDMGATLGIVLDALRQTGIRAILSTGWGGVEVPSRPNLYVAGFVPHDWLFAHVSAVVHHGGAGTTAAGILAGKPTLIIPFGGDQPFWGQRVQLLGLGPKPLPREKLTVRKLCLALRRLTSEKRYSVAARELGERMRKEDGAITAANIVEHELRKWLREEGQTPDIVPPAEELKP
ncbi:MAG: glycosyltransferase [Clostridia bacterium]